MDTQTGLISVMAKVEDITAGKYLVGRFGVDDDKLTQVLLNKNATDIPPANEHAVYRLLTTEPLDQWIGQKVTNWNGASPITLFFNAITGVFDHYEVVGAGKTAAA